MNDLDYFQDQYDRETPDERMYCLRCDEEIFTYTDYCDHCEEVIKEQNKDKFIVQETY